MTIAGAFWVGILAARRLRDWGDGRHALPEGEGGPQLALAAASGGNSHPPHDPASQRVRARVAERLRGRAYAGAVPRSYIDDDPATPDLGLANLRQGDVVLVNSSDPERDGDYLVDGVLNLREGAATTVIAVLNDVGKRRWLIGAPARDQWLWLAPVTGHGLVGEPPRHIRQGDLSYALERRGQASAAGAGMHGRPALPRVATYLYRCESTRVLWLERWGDQVLMGEGVELPSHFVGFLPGQG
ncbi:MAG: DUF4178 domain-containing protein [Myxococcales bacterium]|nr:DUF4178 domain-containing protein [Myxococcales bacterium]MCB9752134.1 DUF4178 domain-containing protein [Myxococcales bacterium]